MVICICHIVIFVITAQRHIVISWCHQGQPEVLEAWTKAKDQNLLQSAPLKTFRSSLLNFDLIIVRCGELKTKNIFSTRLCDALNSTLGVDSGRLAAIVKPWGSASTPKWLIWGGADIIIIMVLIIMVLIIIMVIIIMIREGHTTYQPTVMFKRTKHHKGSIYCLAWSPRWIKLQQHIKGEVRRFFFIGSKFLSAPN